MSEAAALPCNRFATLTRINRPPVLRKLGQKNAHAAKPHTKYMSEAAALPCNRFATLTRINRPPVLDL